MLRTAILTLTTVTSLTACLETSYHGRDPRKAYVTMQAGQRGYTRNGEFHSDVFGGGLVEVVQGNRQAEEAANTFHDRMVGGFLATLVGAVCMPAALTYDLAHNTNADGDTAISPWLPYAEIGCFALMIGGSIAMVSAVPYQLDAINIYNDGVDAMVQWQVPRFPAAPPVAAPPPAPDQSPAAGPPGAD